MGFDQVDQFISLMSLALAIFFWWNTRQQAPSAERTLDQIKSQIIGWQDQLNKTAVDMLASRPEMIARQVTLTESETAANFSDKMAELVEKLALSDDSEKAKIIEAILTNHAGTILERQRIGIDAANARSG